MDPILLIKLAVATGEYDITTIAINNDFMLLLLPARELIGLR